MCALRLPSLRAAPSSLPRRARHPPPARHLAELTAHPVRLRLVFVLAAAFGVLYLAHVRGYTSTALSYAGVAGDSSSSSGGDFGVASNTHGHGLTAAHADHVQVIVTFKKGASSADKAAILDGVVAKGGKVVDKSDADSSSELRSSFFATVNSRFSLPLRRRVHLARLVRRPPVRLA